MHPRLDPFPPAPVLHILKADAAIEMECLRPCPAELHLVRPAHLLRLQAKRVLQDPPEEPFRPDADLPVHARHAARRFVGGIHHGVVKAVPGIERVCAI